MTKNQTNNKTEKVQGERPQEIKTMKTTRLSTTIMSNVITGFVVGVAMFITGYFMSVNMHADARKNVVNDMQIVKATVEPLKK